MVNDLLNASDNKDNKQVSVLTLLDLSAASDTSHNTMLIHRLQHRFGILDHLLSGFILSCLKESRM